MTVEGAISELNNLLKVDDIPIYYKPSIAKVMETIMLESNKDIEDAVQEDPDAVVETECEDAISRKAAFAILSQALGVHFDETAYYKQLMALPPVQLKSQLEYGDCGDFQYWIDEIQDVIIFKFEDGSINTARLGQLRKKLMMVRNIGHWIKGKYWSTGCGMGEEYGYWYKCSECGHLTQGDYDVCEDKFCSKCGARMLN